MPVCRTTRLGTLTDTSAVCDETTLKSISGTDQPTLVDESGTSRKKKSRAAWDAALEG